MIDQRAFDQALRAFEHRSGLMSTRVEVAITTYLACKPDQARIAELQAEVARLEDQLDEARHAPWPQWADDIRKKLEEYGVDVGPENEWDIGEQFENWIDGAVEDALRQHSATLEKHHAP
jgi:hypothetical protein